MCSYSPSTLSVRLWNRVFYIEFQTHVVDRPFSIVKFISVSITTTQETLYGYKYTCVRTHVCVHFYKRNGKQYDEKTWSVSLEPSCNTLRKVSFWDSWLRTFPFGWTMILWFQEIEDCKLSFNLVQFLMSITFFRRTFCSTKVSVK